MISLDKKLGLWVWQSPSILDRIHEVVALGFDYLLVKIADGQDQFEAAALQQIIHDAESICLPILGWAYVYPDLIAEEVDIISMILHKYPQIQALVFDAETEWNLNTGTEAEKLLTNIAANTQHKVPFWLSTFSAIHIWENNFPYESFLKHCEGGFMPQLYLEGSTPPDLVFGRGKLSCPEMAAKSLGKGYIPTINDPNILTGMIPDIKGANIWLWDGTAIPYEHLKHAGQDMGVNGLISYWKDSFILAKKTWAA